MPTSIDGANVSSGPQITAELKAEPDTVATGTKDSNGESSADVEAQRRPSIAMQSLAVFSAPITIAETTRSTTPSSTAPATAAHGALRSSELLQSSVPLSVDALPQLRDGVPEWTITKATGLSAGAHAGAAAPATNESSVDDTDLPAVTAIDALEVAGTALSLGTLWWILRGAGVAGGLFATMPVWRDLDPLPVVGPALDDESTATDDAQTSMLSRDMEMERTVGEVLEAQPTVQGPLDR